MAHQLLTDAEYGKVLDNIAVGCVDVAILFGDEVLLVRRETEPIKGQWWIFGGRLNKGEDLTAAAQRGVLRELSLQISDNNRFIQVGCFNLIWPTRREPPAENGCHHLLIAYALVVNNEEKDYLDTQTKKLESIKWFKRKDALTGTAIPELKDILSKLPKFL